MSVALILFVITLIVFILVIFREPANQRYVNIFILIVLLVILAAQCGWFKNLV